MGCLLYNFHLHFKLYLSFKLYLKKSIIIPEVKLKLQILMLSITRGFPSPKCVG